MNKPHDRESCTSRGLPLGPADRKPRGGSAGANIPMVMPMQSVSPWGVQLSLPAIAKNQQFKLAYQSSSK
jgi:hypothetical protein